MDAAIAKLSAVPSTQWRVVAVSKDPPHSAVVECEFPTKLAALHYVGPRLSRSEHVEMMVVPPS